MLSAHRTTAMSEGKGIRNLISSMYIPRAGLNGGAVPIHLTKECPTVQQPSDSAVPINNGLWSGTNTYHYLVTSGIPLKAVESGKS